jgi:hypothetical protein
VGVNLRRRNARGERKIKVGLCNFRSRDSAVGIATGYGLDDRGVGFQVPVGSRIFSPPPRTDRLWGPPNLSNGYRGFFPRGQSGRSVKLVPRSRKCGSIKPLPHTPSWCGALLVKRFHPLRLFLGGGGEDL